MMAAWTRRRGWLLLGAYCMACSPLLAETGATGKNSPSQLANELLVGDKPPAVGRWVVTQTQGKLDTSISRWGAEAGTSLSQVVRVEDAALLWTGLLSPREASGQLLNPGDPIGQTRAILRQLRWLLEAAGGSLDQLLRLNVYAASPHVIP